MKIDRLLTSSPSTTLDSPTFADQAHPPYDVATTGGNTEVGGIDLIVQVKTIRFKIEKNFTGHLFPTCSQLIFFSKQPHMKRNLKKFFIILITTILKQLLLCNIITIIELPLKFKP